VFEWRLASHWSPLEIDEQQWFIDAIMEASGGRIEITAFPSEALLPQTEALMAVGEGMIDMCLGYGGYWDDIMPVAGLETGMPFGWRNRAEAAAFFYEAGFLDLIRKAYAEHNVYYIAPVFCASYTVMSTVPIHSLEDWAKLTTRVAGPSADVLMKVAIPTTYIPGAELYLALATGVVDAFAWCCPYTYYLLKYYEVCDYLIEPALVDPLATNLFINMDVWNALPDDLKAIVETTAKASLTRASAYWTYGNADAITKMVTEHGVTVITLTPEAVAKLTEASFAVWDELAAKDPVYAAPAVKMLKDFVRAMGHM